MMQSRWLTLFASIAIIGCSDQTSERHRADLLIRDVVILSPHDLKRRPATDVLIRGGLIDAIGPSAETQAAESTAGLDGAGRFLIPGLIDGHTHLNEVPGMTFNHEQKYPGVAADARRQIPRSYLYHGFTTVIDLNAHPDVIAQWNSQAIGPRAYFCGAAPVFDGYPTSYIPKPVRYKIMPYFLYDEARSADFPDGFEPRLHTPEAVVERIHAGGGICVKTHHERGFRGRGDLPVPAVDLVRQLVAAAHAKELPVLLHANSESAQSFGVAAGVDAFAHGMWTWNDRAATEMSPAIESIVDATLARDIAVQPTIQVLYGEQDIHNPAYLDDARLTHVLPSSLLDWYRTDDGQWWRRRMLEVPIVARLVDEGLWMELDAPPIARVSAVLRYFADRDGRLLFGSDTPSDPTFANPPGLNGRFEMDRWIEAGVSLPTLFRAATIDNAKFFGLDSEIGSIEVGKRADLLLLGKSPLDDVSAYDTIEYVILAGAAFERSSFSALAD